MALPPLPLDELLERAHRVVLAEVTEVTGTGLPAAPAAQSARTGGAFAHPIGAAPPRGPQQARLRVEEVLAGPPFDAPGEAWAHKPPSGYVLVEGVRGVFFLDERGHILGEQGPDEHGVDAVRRARA